MNRLLLHIVATLLVPALLMYPSFAVLTLAPLANHRDPTLVTTSFETSTLSLRLITGSGLIKPRTAVVAVTLALLVACGKSSVHTAPVAMLMTSAGTSPDLK